MTAEEFLQKLEQADLTPPEIVASLRRQVAAAKEPIAPAAIAKLLVDKGHLTGNQSQRLLGNPTTSSIGKAQTSSPAAAPSAIQNKAATSGVQKSPATTQPTTPSQPVQPKPKAPAASLSSSNILDDVGLTPLDELSLGTPSSLGATSSIHSGIHSKPAAKSPALSGSNVLDDVGLAPLDDLSMGPLSSPSSPAGKSSSKSAPRSASLSGSNVLSDAPAAVSGKSSLASSSSKIDDLGLVSEEGPSRAPPPPGSLAAKALAQKEAERKQNAAESISTIQKAAAAEAAIQKAASSTAIGTKTQAPKPAPVPKPAPIVVAPEALPSLDELSPLDDLATLDLNDFAPPPSAPSPLGAAALAPAPSPLGPDPLGPGPLGLDPLGGSTDLGAITAQTASPLGQPAPEALAAAAAANESRTTMLVGGIMGGVALLVIVIGLAVYFWPRGSGMLEFQAAEQAYQEKQYSAAIEKYNVLLKLFPRHEQASLVKVHRGMSSIHDANPASGDWSRILPILSREVNLIATEAQLPQVHAELVPLLIQQCEALADAATKPKTGDDPAAKLQEARSALALCNDARLVPSSLRPWQKMADIEERLQLLGREQDRSAAREAARASLAQHATAGNAQPFFQERAKLLASYPELASDALWSELGASLAEAAPKTAKSSATKKPTAKEPPASPWLKNIPWHTLSVGQTNEAPAPGRLAIVNAIGAVYGLDPTTGKVYWSRYVAAPPSEAPVVSSDGTSLWLVDRARNELLCLKAGNGTWIWSQPLASPALGGPVLAGDRLYLTLASGSVQAFNALSGELLAAVELPQPAGGRLTLTADGKQLAQVANEGLLYLLSAETLQVEKAIYLGHDRGTARFPPVAFAQQVIVASRRGEQTDLHTIALAGSKPEVKRLTVDGAIGSALLVVGQRLLVPTEPGKIHALELAEGSEPLRLAHTLDAPSGRTAIRHLSASTGGVCAADQGCALLKFNSQGKLEPGWSALVGESCDAAGLLTGESILTTHYNAAQAIAWVSAINASDGQVSWQSPLGCSVNLLASADAGGPPAVIPLQNLPADFAGSKGAAVRTRISFSFTALGNDRLAVVERGRPELLTYERSADAATPWQPRKLMLPGAALAGVPALCGNHLLVPLTDGSIQCLDPQTAESTAAPFVLPGGGSIPLPPVVLAIGEDGKEAIVFDGSRSLVKIARVDQPQPHWAEQAATRLNEPLAAAPVLLGDTLFAVDRRGLVQSFTLPDLATGQTQELRGAIAIWGPHRCGECVLLATDGDELVGLDDARLPRWQHPLPQGPLVGSPLAHENNVVILARSGVVEVRSLSSGDVIGSVDLQQPLAGPGLIAGNTLWLATSAGQVLHVAIPTATATAKESP